MLARSQTRIFYGATLILCLVNAARLDAGWIVGNGGDGLRLAFAKAREHAAHVVSRMHEHALAGVTPSVRKWILANRQALAADIMASSHLWTLEQQPSCAWTDSDVSNGIIPNHKPVELSLPTCLRSIDSFMEAAELLIHESVHHFGIVDEPFADAVALAIYGAWRSGKADWTLIAKDDSPKGRSYHSAVWTGDSVIIFGGQTRNGDTNTGYVLNPKSLTWTPISNEGAPRVHGQKALFLNGKMYVWGGFKKSGSGKSWQNAGAFWDEASDRWSQLSTPYGGVKTDAYVSQRPLQSLTAGGDKLYIWGGKPDQNDRPIGGIYDTTAKSWTHFDGYGAPFRNGGHTAVWTGRTLIIWGGLTLANDPSDEGAIYNPTTKEWADVSTEGAPRQRWGHTAVWTGNKMIVFAGYDASRDIKGTGGIYDPETDSWSPIVSEMTPGRIGHSIVWTGKELLVWGGRSKRLQSYFNTISAFDPESGSWRAVTGSGVPAPRQYHAAVWTGASMIVWGGEHHRGVISGDGGMFYP